MNDPHTQHQGSEEDRQRENETPQDLDAVPTEEEVIAEDVKQANDAINQFNKADIPHLPTLPSMIRGDGGITSRPGDPEHNPVEEAARKANDSDHEPSDR